MSQTIRLEFKVVKLTSIDGLETVLSDLSAEGWELQTTVAGYLVLNRLPQEPKKKPSELTPNPKKNEGKPKTETPKEKPKEGK